MADKSFYISTAIPYVNGEPHIGHALEYVQTDVLARYYRLKGYRVFFCSGTDENALKNVQTAEKEGITTQEVVDKYSKPFAEFQSLLNISYDKFVRTSEEYHHRASQELWQRCQHDIYKKAYRGFYCVGCEEFKTEKDLDENGMCPEHKKKPELIEEKNYFFKLSKYQHFLEKLIEDDKLKITPKERKNEVLSFIRSGLQDFSISRSKQRAKGWGIPVPGDEEQYIYVWFDALINYITGLGFPDDTEDYKTFWADNPHRNHIIGKGISRFHALYWPAMLQSAGVPLPTQEFIHGYITIQGDKISKSLDNVITPNEVVDKYGTDAFRYYLLKEIHPFKDGDFSWDRFAEVYNADLANGLGNLVQRVSKMAERSQLGFSHNKNNYYQNHEGETSTYIQHFRFDEALSYIWNHLKRIDKQVDTQKPWELKGTKLKTCLDELIFEILQVAGALRPFLPQTSENIEDVFTAEKITAPSKPLFPRINANNELYD